MVELGYMYYYGEGHTQDYLKARELLEKAAENENVLAMSSIGYSIERD